MARWASNGVKTKTLKSMAGRHENEKRAHIVSKQQLPLLVAWHTGGNVGRRDNNVSCSRYVTWRAHLDVCARVLAPPSLPHYSVCAWRGKPRVIQRIININYHQRQITKTMLLLWRMRCCAGGARARAHAYCGCAASSIHFWRESALASNVRWRDAAAARRQRRASSAHRSMDERRRQRDRQR